MGAREEILNTFRGKIQEPQATIFPGCYEATVEDVNDPLQLKRYRVRVHAVHPPELDKSFLPFAEQSLMGGKQWGDFVSYAEGDGVWIMFKAGNKDYPVILGGKLSKSFGVHDLPPEMQADYATNERKWCRIDRAGNMVELNPLPGEEYIRLKSGNTELKLSKAGLIEIITPIKYSLSSSNYSQWCAQLSLQIADNGLITCEKVYTLLCNGQMDLHAANDINIGTYRDPLWPVNPQKSTKNISLRATDNINEVSDGAVFRQSQQDMSDDVKGDFKRTVLGKTTIASGMKLALSVKTGGYDIVIEDGDLIADVKTGDLKANVEVGKVAVTAMGEISAKSQTSVALEAPQVSIKGTAQITLDTPLLDLKGDMTKMEGSMLQIDHSMIKMNGSAMVIIDGGLIKVG